AQGDRGTDHHGHHLAATEGLVMAVVIGASIALGRTAPPVAARCRNRSRSPRRRRCRAPNPARATRPAVLTRTTCPYPVVTRSDQPAMRIVALSSPLIASAITAASAHGEKRRTVVAIC